MLTDIFAERYSSRIIWDEFTEAESRLLIQSFRIVAEQLIPYYVNGKESSEGKAKWKAVHDRLSMELGVEELTPRFYSYQTTWMGKPFTQSGMRTYEDVCRTFVSAPYEDTMSPDRFMKERLSFVELAFRLREEEITAENLRLPEKIKAAKMQDLFKPITGLLRTDSVTKSNDSLNASFRASVDELNERFRRAGTQLNYHNGFVQVTTDKLVEEQIERVFWRVLADPVWKNVDIDMKEALDRRDANDRDPAFYAARALESAIKIISDQKGWTHGGENGAHNYIDNLSSRKNGEFIKGWERDTLKSFFTSIRNPFGHGPGTAVMPQLTAQQTDWAIETCMSWIRSLVQRM
jgi:hypothetical protein